jgi:hypothetical protein
MVPAREGISTGVSAPARTGGAMGALLIKNGAQSP